ncbi:MAG: hypothetical protein ACI8RZ_004508 [Myxococcota bacterium]
MALEEFRSEFLSGDNEERYLAEGERLFWVRDSNWDLELSSWNSRTGATIHYDFTIGGSASNGRVGTDHIVFAEENGPQVLYHLYAIDSTDTLIGSLSVDAPGDEQKWWAYAPWGGALHLALTTDGITLVRWFPRDEPEPMEMIHDLSDAGMGEFGEFGVDDDNIVLTESGRIWHLDRSSRVLTWLENETEVTDSVVMTDDGFGYATSGEGMFYWGYDGQQRHISAEIEAADYQINTTFASHHLPSRSSFALVGSLWIYEGSGGVFAYDLNSGAIEPVVLDTRESPWITYRDPQVLDDGTLFVLGLTSESGVTGAQDRYQTNNHPSAATSA